jgi:phosphinothricin acetyltransferase
VHIRPLQEADWPDVAAIFEEGMATGFATLDTEVPTWEAWNARFLPDHRMVAAGRFGTIAGWAALAPVSERGVYAGVAEVSVYVAAAMRGQGFGSHLLNALITGSEAGGIWTLQASVFPENEASIRLHHANGFRTVGVRERIGERNGIWHDITLMERRSRVVSFVGMTPVPAGAIPEAS